MLPGGIFNVNSMQSQSMAIREDRLKLAKTHSEKTQRELARDRTALERKEKQLLGECKRLASKGDINGARMIANQIASYRRIHDRNLAASIQIGTKAQALFSDHKVNRGQVESIKGFTFANYYESFARSEAREQRYSYRMNAINHLESSFKDSLEEAYRGDGCGEDGGDGIVAEDQMSPSALRIHELEIQTILGQALGQKKHRVYIQDTPESGSASKGSAFVSGAPFILNFKSFDNPQLGCSLTLNPMVSQSPSASFGSVFSSNTCTIDQVKRLLSQDIYAMGQLGLVHLSTAAIKPFELGRIDTEAHEFQVYDFSDTIAKVGLESGDLLLVRILDSPSTPNVGDVQDELLRLRINRINSLNTTTKPK